MEKAEFRKKLNEQCLTCAYRQVIRKMGTNEILKILCNANGYMVENWQLAEDSMHKFSDSCPNYTERFLANIYEKCSK